MSSPVGAAYALLALIVLLAPFAARMFPVRIPAKAATVALAVIQTGALLLTAMRGTFVLAAVASIAIIVLRRRPAICGAIAATLLFATANWWWRPDVSGVAQAFLTALCAAAWAVAAIMDSLSKDAAARDQPRRIAAPVLGAFVIGILAGLPTAPYAQVLTSHTAWHHWGAFISPVEAWLSGGAPYRDFPVQYGLGPMVLLAASCAGDCWRATYWIAVLANAAYFAVLVGCAAIVLRRSSRGLYWLGLIALFFATLVWTAFPAQLATAVMTPSVGGLRFLPLAALVLHIASAQASGRKRDWLGHGLWLLGLFWSPEAAGFATLVWWPYLALRDLSAAPSGRDAVAAVMARALQGAGFLAAGAALLALCVWLISARGATASDFFMYILHPPGVYPANLIGPVWLFAITILMGVATFWRASDPAANLRLYVLLLALLAGGSYYVSRSHDNNLLNLLPWLVLVLLALAQRAEAASEPADLVVAGFVRGSLAVMVAFVLTINPAAWFEGASRIGLLSIGPERLIVRFTPTVGEQPPQVAPDAAAALTYLRDRHAGAVMFCDETKVVPRGDPRSWWTGVNSVANFVPLPDAVIRHYIQRGARSYRRAGWLVVAPQCTRQWLGNFQTAYRVTEQRRFGTYQAFQMEPLSDLH